MSSHSLAPYTLLVMRKDNSILLTRRGATGFADGLYALVGGKVEKNETFRQALMREAFEEVGVTVKQDDLDFVHMFHRKGTEGEIVAVLFQAKQWQGIPFNKEPHKHTSIEWFGLDQLPDNIIPAHKQALELMRKNIAYSEHNWT